MDVVSRFHVESGLTKRRPTIEKIASGIVDVTQSKERDKNERRIIHPMLKPSAHFHYDHVDFDCFQAFIAEEETHSEENDLYSIRVLVNNRAWVVHRAFDHFKILDKQIHSCVFDRGFSNLTHLEQFVPTSTEDMDKTLVSYLVKFSELALDHTFFCGTVLHFFEVDNKGSRLTEECSAINIPAIGAAQAVKRYTKQASDELSLEVGDMVSVIDKPSIEESTWWRGKKTFEVGFFPSDCVQIIGNSSGAPLPGEITIKTETKPVFKRRGKVVSFLRMFIPNRPQRTTLKRDGIVRERVFGCDLAEHLSNFNLEVPHVLKCCTEIIELQGAIDGIYRLSGVNSHIQRLRAQFDEGSLESFEDDDCLDLHTVTAVLKMYFRELPNPLITYQLYETFAEAVSHKGDVRLAKLKKAMGRLPPPHYRTAAYLFAHLNRMIKHNTQTAMDSRNLAIVWSPNLMRSKALESGTVTGAQILHSVSVQATVVESLITHYEYIFNDDDVILRADSNNKKVVRPSSVAGSTPSRLLSLSEAQDRIYAEVYPNEDGSRAGTSYNSSEVGKEKDILPVFHTVIEFSDKKKMEYTRESYSSTASNSTSQGGLGRDSSSSRWRSFFHRNKHSVKSSKKTDIEAWINATHEKESEDITDNEIAHLSRRLQSSSSTSNIHSKLSGSLSELVGDSDSYGLVRSASNLDIDDESSVMARAASHESFFEPPVQLVSSAVPTVLPSIETPIKSSITPGVVFRPAYKGSKEDLLSKPKGTWKQSTGSINPPPSHIASSLLGLSNIDIKTATAPYVSPASKMSRDDEVRPLLFAQSPGAQRKQVRCFSQAEDQHTLYADDENPYETIGPQRFPRKKSASPPSAREPPVLSSLESSISTQSEQLNRPTAAFTTSISSNPAFTTSASSNPVSSCNEPSRSYNESPRSYNEVYRSNSYSSKFHDESSKTHYDSTKVNKESSRSSKELAGSRSVSYQSNLESSRSNINGTSGPASPQSASACSIPISLQSTSQLSLTVSEVSSPNHLSPSQKLINEKFSPQAPSLAPSLSWDPLIEYNTSDVISLDELELEWGRAEMLQCVNQAEQARLSRSYSAHTSSSGASEHRGSNRSSYRRTFTDEVCSVPDSIPEFTDETMSEEGSSQTAADGEPLYENLDPMATINNQAAQMYYKLTDKYNTDIDSSLDTLKYETGPKVGSELSNESNDCTKQTNFPAAANVGTSTSYSQINPQNNAECEASQTHRVPYRNATSETTLKELSPKLGRPPVASTNVTKYSRPVGASKSYTHSDSQKETECKKPRAHSIPFRMSPSSRRKESDVDTAIANASNIPVNAPIISMQPSRKPSRNAEYVNLNLYQEDPRKGVPRLPRQKSADRQLTNTSKGLYEPLNLPHTSATNSNSASRLPRPSVGRSQSVDQPSPMRPEPECDIIDSFSLFSEHSVSPAPSNSSIPSAQSYEPERQRLWSADLDSLLSTDDKAVSRPTPRQRRTTPPITPRKRSTELAHPTSNGTVLSSVENNSALTVNDKFVDENRLGYARDSRLERKVVKSLPSTTSRGNWLPTSQQTTGSNTFVARREYQ